MRNLTIKPGIIITIFFIASLCFGNQSKAAGAAGGELIYQWVSDSTYRFFFALDQACGNGAEPSTMPLCLYNSCTNTTFSRTMNKWTGTPPSTGSSSNRCPNVATNCNSTTSTIQGYKTFWYSLTITLPIRCQWKVFTYTAGRNPATNNIDSASYTSLYIEATFNNTIALNNSSPYYQNRALVAVYRNQRYTIDYEAKDPNNDSIVTQLIHPLKGVSACNDTPVNVTYTTDTPAISIPTNPFQTGNGSFLLNSSNGAHDIKSAKLGGNSYAIRTSEYRNGVLIGTVMKEAQIQTFRYSSNITIDVPTIIGTSWSSNQVNGCINQTVTFSFDRKSNNTNARLIVSDNHNSVIPNANVTITNQVSDSVHYVFSWTPSANDAGLNNIIITTLDSTCNPPGILQTYAFTLPIYVWPATKVSADTIINAGENAQLSVTGGGNYLWTILPGGTANSLNNPNIANPTVTPTTTTSYVVTSGATSFCNNNKDTVTVIVRPPTKGVAGGDISYEWLGDSTYRFFVKIYQDCGSGSAPDSIPICLRDTCNNTTLSYLMPKWQGSTGGNIFNSGFGTSLGCGLKTTCDSINSTIPGYKANWYYKIVTLPSRCNSWKVSSYVSGRNANINNILNPTTSTIYLEATFNNTISNNNSSPYYTIRPIPYAFVNANTNYNIGAVDPNLDSLVTEVIHPLTGVRNCSDTPVAVYYKNLSPSISIPNNHFQTGTNNFSVNPATGATSFTATTAGRNSYAIRTKEYRNGTLIGSIMREIQVQTFIGQAPTPNIFTVGCGITMPTTNNPLDICIGQPISFCFSISNIDKNARLKILDNSSSVTPGATITYSGQGSNIINGTFNWTPTRLFGGSETLSFTIVDSTCRPPGIILYDIKHLPIKVWSKTYAGPDLLICPNESVTLKALYGGFYNWTILSGTPNSLSNTNIADPIASPNTTTTYAVVSNLNSFCANNKDTVIVDIRPQSMVTKPSISISISPDSNITQGTPVNFTATPTNCNNPSYQWTSMGVKLPGETDSTFNSSTIFNYQSITCLLNCADTCSSPRDTFSNAITMRFPTSISHLSKHTQSDIVIYPNPNNGTFTIKLNRAIGTEEQLHIDIINYLGQVVYSKQGNFSNNSQSDNISMEEIPSGVYLLKVSSTSSSITSSFTISR